MKKSGMLKELNKLLKLKSISGENIDKFLYLFLDFFEKNKSLQKKVDNRIIKTKKKRKLTFNVNSSKMIISDPGYVYPEKKSFRKRFLGAKTYNVEKGEWEGFYYSWITNYPNIVVVSNKKYKFPSKKIKYKHGGTVSVDSGQLIVLDVKEVPKNDKGFDKWFDKIYDSLEKRHASKIKGGYCFKTGFGDGQYDYTVGRVGGKVVQFIMKFIP